MRVVTSDKLCELQKSTSNIRNICILAHVDHGKTTLADSLVANNGIISPKLAGKLRYLDSREDEQERGITMKSSSIALYYATDNSKQYLINLIDSPGHVDFSSEVSTAVRLCDGAIVIVDVIEGVCAQTRVALQQAWSEGLKPVLVLNKIDRLIIERGLSSLDAYVHLNQVLEQVNAVMGEMFCTEVMSKEDAKEQISTEQNGIYDWSTGLEESDDTNLYFTPETGNVVFASATDGWAFSIANFAKMYAEKLSVKPELLEKVLWGNFYLNSKTKRFMKGAQEKAKKPLFVQFILDNIWALYETIMVRKDREKIPMFVEKLGIKLTPRDLRHTDPKTQLQAVFSQWLPLANAVLDMVCNKLPSPLDMTIEKVEKLMCSQTQRFDSLPKKTQDLKEAFLACDTAEDKPVIVFISKMFSVDRSTLPQNKAKPLSAEEMAKRRELARARHAERLAKSEQGIVEEIGNSMQSMDLNVREGEKQMEEPLEDTFVAFARVFSGTLKVGQKVFVLGPKHDPRTIKIKDIDLNVTLKDLKSNQFVSSTTISNIYLLMGKDLEELKEVPAGNVIGIGGLEDHVLKTATLSTTLDCPSFTEVQQMVDPIVRVAVEPKNLNDMNTLIKGLRLLNQADACVQVYLQGTGEHVLATAGEVHLERCLEDLKSRYAKIPIKVSDPIVPFRETIVVPPVVDMVNEEIQGQAKTLDNDKPTETTIEIWSSNHQSCLKVRALPLPSDVTEILEKNVTLLKTIDNYFANKFSKEIEEGTLLTERTLQSISELKEKLRKAFENNGKEWDGFVENIWSCGPRKCGPNLLINNTGNYVRSSYWSIVDNSATKEIVRDLRHDFDSSFVNGFQLVTLDGPLCGEPMYGVCFVVDFWEVDQEKLTAGNQPFGPASGQIMSSVKEGCRRAFIAQPQRLVAAMYSCNIMVSAEVLGKMYAVLGRRHGRILAGDMTQSSATFTVTAVLPVIESFSFASEIRKQTSGLASPQLFFSHWEVIDIDPYWTPSTEEEYLHFGEKADSGNRARRYMDAVRRRKGLTVEEKLVEFGEKQRTLSKNK